MIRFLYYEHYKDYLLEVEKQVGEANIFKMFFLMKRFCRTLWKQVISFLKNSNLKEKLVINSLNSLLMSIKNF